VKGVGEVGGVSGGVDRAGARVGVAEELLDGGERHTVQGEAHPIGVA